MYSFIDHTTWHVGILVPYGFNQYPLQRKHSALTTGLPGSTIDSELLLGDYYVRCCSQRILWAFYQYYNSPMKKVLLLLSPL